MQIEWLILADAAQVVGGKLYLMGGGWNRITVNRGFPLRKRIAAAVAIEVAWGETNERHPFEVEIMDGDAKSLGKVGGQFEVGRPPGVPPGITQRVQMAVDIDLEIRQPGTFEVIARIPTASEERKFPFFVVGGPTLAQKPQLPSES